LLACSATATIKSKARARIGETDSLIKKRLSMLTFMVLTTLFRIKRTKGKDKMSITSSVDLPNSSDTHFTNFS